MWKKKNKRVKRIGSAESGSKMSYINISREYLSDEGIFEWRIEGSKVASQGGF